MRRLKFVAAIGTTDVPAGCSLRDPLRDAAVRARCTDLHGTIPLQRSALATRARPNRSGQSRNAAYNLPDRAPSRYTSSTDHYPLEAYVTVTSLPCFAGEGRG